MKLFQNIFKPKWKNSDPEIRKQALIHLDKDSHQEVFIDVAANDPVSELRLLAIKRINNLDKVNEIALSDKDSKIIELGNKILCQMLSGEITGNLDAEQRLEKVSNLENQKVLEYIAQKGDNATLRLAAIKKVMRESLLGNLAINDNEAEIRHIAINRVTQKSTLERVLKATKTKDKAVSRVAKEKLDEIVREEELPIKLLNDQKSLCSKMEALGAKGLWERDKIQFDNLSRQWEELSEGQTLELLKRFEEAKTRFSNSYQAYLQRYEEQLKKEAELLPIKEEKQKFIAELSALLATFGENPSFSDDEVNTYKNQVAEKEKLWQAMQSLPAELESELGTQFNDIAKTIRKVISTFESEKNLVVDLSALEKSIDSALNNTARLTENTIQRTQKQLSALSIGHLPDEALTVKNRIANKINKANSKLQDKEQHVNKLIDEIKNKLPKLDDALTKGILRDATNLRNSVQNNLKKLDRLNVKGIHKYKNQLVEASAKIAELHNWKSWANTPQKEALIEKVEALIDSDDDPKEIAFIVSQARKEWKKLGASEKDTSQELWEKFQEVCDKAFEPCKAFFEKESEVREQNYQIRVAFLDNFEQFINITDWETVDWKKVEQLHRQAKNEWRTLGQTDIEQRKELNKRFYAAYNILRDKLKEEWHRNFDAKQSLIDAAVELESEDDLRTAITKAKELQNNWKKGGRIEPSKERELWKSFKAACDKVFARRDEVHKQKVQEAAETLNNKETLCEQIEQLAQTAVEEIEQARPELHKLQKEFELINTNAREKEKELKRRVNDALDIFERKLESFGKLEKLIMLKTLEKTAQLCEEAEAAIEQGSSSDKIETIVSKIKELEKVANVPWQQKLEKRVEQLSKLDNDALKSLIDQNYDDLNIATIQLEILADMETPADSSEQRLKIQAQRLSEKLQNHEDKNAWEEFLEIEASWLSIGPVDSKRLALLKSRRATAISALRNEYPTELNNYL